MSHFGDFMEGVPVKISEKYKRPPRIDLPYSVIERPQRAQNLVESIRYCSTFENNVLSKLKELRSAKRTKKNEWRHRLQLLEEAKQKKLDEIAAAEAEEKLKELSVSDVTYPSTEEITAILPDGKCDQNCDSTPVQGSPEQSDMKIENDFPNNSQETETQLNILKPIQVQSNYQQNNLLEDLDPLEELKMNVKLAQLPQYHRNVETMTFKDFENDNSSPFDNVELKTINEMELLAQVLQNQRVSTSSPPIQPCFVPTNPYVVTNCSSQAQIEGLTYLPNNYTEQPTQGPCTMYSSPQHYPNSYFMPTESVCENPMPIPDTNMYTANYQYYVPADPYASTDPYFSQVHPNIANSQIPNESQYIPQAHYYHYPQSTMQYASNTCTIGIQSQSSEKVSSHTIKSRSRSVPDIVKELDQEIVFAKLRATERSYNASPAPEQPQPSSSTNNKEERRSKRQSEHLPNPFNKLPPKVQSMCQRIHGMGFPLDRVARVCTLLGDNDKKVIEGLLIIDELMDLGFPEGKVTGALANHEFNKDKALEEILTAKK